ncbi:MAG TPA: MerR family transcriptional regulator [Gammaproteobacteria bacterium]|nr:MerR family transcriptional regulator [Gammaproteobacteria bacterium]
MPYTVNTLAKISGVSVRTLHHYDEIGLLKPAYYGENNYRYYEEEQLLMLQQILFYRELQFSLIDIEKILKSDRFNKVKALMAHKDLLITGLEQKKRLLKTIDKTIVYLRGEKAMKHEDLFYGFNSTKQKNYEAYLIKHGYVTAEETTQKRLALKKWKKADWDNFIQISDMVLNQFVEALEKNLPPDSETVQALTQKHFELILLPFWSPDKEHYLGLIELYQTPEFGKFYEKYHPALLDFLSVAMKIYANAVLH